MSDVILAPETLDLDKLAGAIAGWVADKLPGARDIAVANLAYPRGAGQSHETILFDLAWTEHGERRTQGCVVRIRPGGFTVFPETLFEEQYEVMRVLSERGPVRVARPLWIERDPAVLGKPFFVMEKRVGRVPGSIPPYAKSGWLAEATPAQRRRLWENAVGQLAAIQRVPVASVRFLEGPPHARDGLAQEWDKYERSVAWLRPDPCCDALAGVLERLRAAWPANQPEGMVWGDARIGNMMFDDDFRVVAVTDWEQPSLGGALHDLAWFCTVGETMHGRNAIAGAYVEGMGSRDETVALWEELSGKSAAGLEWYEDFAGLKMSFSGIRLDQLRGTQMMRVESITRRLKSA